ncbi:hypothetical protein ACFW04_011475 [Cataglyphis niger]
MIYWIYSAILRPRLLYAAVVWWPRIQLASAKVSLEHLRALILRGALEAMKTTPIAAMEMLFSIEPLCHMVVSAAALAAYRLKSIRALKAPFKLCFPERKDWIQPQNPVLKNGFILFTDGSRIGSSSGAGVHSEIVAILCCAQRLLANKERGRRINICSNSQAALRALEAPTVTSKLVCDCRCILGELASDNEVVLVWVLGHSGIRGNEAVDQPELARRLPDEKPGDSYFHGARHFQHLHKLGFSMRPNCRKCDALEETSLYVLCDCPVYTRIRR